MNDAHWLTAGRSKRLSYCCGAKVQIRGRISRGMGKVKDKIKSNKGAALKGPSVTQLIMSMRRKDEKRDMKCSKNWKVTCLGGTQAVYYFVKYLKVKSDEVFFPGKTCNLMLVRGTISFYNQRLQIFTCWRKCSVEYVNVIKWAMLNVNYFIFNCVSLAIRAF